MSFFLSQVLWHIATLVSGCSEKSFGIAGGRLGELFHRDVAGTRVDPQLGAGDAALEPARRGFAFLIGSGGPHYAAPHRQLQPFAGSGLTVRATKGGFRLAWHLGRYE